jgi:hypothetical protein
VEHRFTVDVDAPAERVFAVVADLTHYASLVDIIRSVEPAGVGPGADTEPQAWMVTLRARLGPLARSKRLRMVRTVHQPPTVARFEREEGDGRHHSPWALAADVEAVDGGSRLTMHLAYGGRLWTSLLDRVLEAQVRRATERLAALVKG